MGDPKKQRRKYERPRHPWKEERITSEGTLTEKYGLVNMKEIWKAKSKIDRYRKGIREIMGAEEENVEEKKEKLLAKLNKIGLIDSHSMDDVLRLTTQDLLERRLQTVVYRKGLCSSIKQARQFIVHGHVKVGQRVVTVPGYLVKKDEEEGVELKKDMKVLKDIKEKTSEKSKESGKKGGKGS